MEENLNLNEGQENVVDSQNTETPVTEPVNAGTEEVTTSQEQGKHVQTAEENAAFAKIRRETETKTKDTLIAEMYGASHGIYTYADFQRALAEEKEQERLQELLNQNIPEEYAKEMIENKKFREQYQEEQKKRSEEEARQKDYEAFLEKYPDTKASEIPATVWEDVSKGISLVDAYTRHENSLLKAKIAEFEKGNATQQANQNNAASSTGSVTGNGTTGSPYFTREQVKEMSQSEVTKNYDAIMESMRQWK